MADDFIPKEGTGSLWKNDNPRSEKSPPYNGKVMINGTLYKLSGFINEARSSGKKYIGLTVRPADEQQAPKSSEPKEDDGWL